MSKGVYYMLAATLCFAFMQALVKTIELPVAEIIVFRAGVSFVLCTLTLLYKRERFFGKHYVPLIGRGIFGVSSLACFFYALQEAPLASVVTIVNIKPFLILFIAGFVLKERVTWRQLLYFSISFAGILMVKGVDQRIDSFALLAVLGAALFAAIAHTIVRYLKGKEQPEVILFYFTLVTLPCVAPFAYVYWQTPVGIEWVQLIGLGLLTHFGQLFLTQAYQSEKMANVSNVYFLGIAFALLFGIFWFKETYSLFAYLGLGLIVIGVVLNVLKKERKKPLLHTRDSFVK